MKQPDCGCLQRCGTSTSLGTLCQRLVTLGAKTFFLTSHLISSCSLKPRPLVVSHSRGGGAHPQSALQGCDPQGGVEPFPLSPLALSAISANGTLSSRPFAAQRQLLLKLYVFYYNLWNKWLYLTVKSSWLSSKPQNEGKMFRQDYLRGAVGETRDS